MPLILDIIIMLLIVLIMLVILMICMPGDSFSSRCLFLWSTVTAGEGKSECEEFGFMTKRCSHCKAELSRAEYRATVGVALKKEAV